MAQHALRDGPQDGAAQAPVAARADYQGSRPLICREGDQRFGWVAAEYGVSRTRTMNSIGKFSVDSIGGTLAGPLAEHVQSVLRVLVRGQ